MKRWILSCIAVTTLALVVGCAGVPKSDPAPKAAVDDGPMPTTVAEVGPGLPDARPIMQAKLVHAQSLLRGLASEDLKLVQANAYNLAMLSEEADWQVHKTLAYVTFSKEFKRNVMSLSKNAEKKNLQGATLDYMAMVMTCVKCHSYMRHEGLVDADRDRAAWDALAAAGR